MSKFTPVTHDEIKALLTESKGWKHHVLPGTKEWVADFELKRFPGVTVRVYTTIRTNGTGKCRSRGSDCFRVFAVDLSTKTGLVKSTRVLRVEGWRDNLRAAIEKTWNVARERATWRRAS